MFKSNSLLSYTQKIKLNEYVNFHSYVVSRYHQSMFN